MNEGRIRELIEDAEKGNLEPEDYKEAVETLDLEPDEEAFMKATGLGLIAENRAEEVQELSEDMLSEKYRADDVFETVIEELEGMNQVYRDHMGRLQQKLSYNAEVWEEVKENIEQASGGDVYVDIDIDVTDEGDTTVINNPSPGGPPGRDSPGDGGSEKGSDDDGYSRRGLLAFAAAGFGGAALGSTLFGGGLFGTGKEEKTEQGYLDRDTLSTIRDETGNYFRNILDENEWSYGTDKEGTDLAGISVRREDNDFDYKLVHINTDEVTDNNWKNAGSIDEILESYDSVEVGDWESIGNEDLGEYMLDASKSENPEKLDFDDYLED